VEYQSRLALSTRGGDDMTDKKLIASVGSFKSKPVYSKDTSVVSLYLFIKVNPREGDMCMY